MPGHTSDERIDQLIRERKPGVQDQLTDPVLHTHGAHERAQVAVIGEAGTPFEVHVRRATLSPHNFSVVLGCRLPGASRLFILRRYNGDHGPHTNVIEGNRIAGFHVHAATERYQATGAAEESYAEATARYSDLDGAIEALIQECAFSGSLVDEGDDHGLSQIEFMSPTQGEVSSDEEG